MFQQCRVSQISNGRILDGILPCDDLDFFPEATRLDKAAKTFALMDAEEPDLTASFRLP
jgi:hypothetical protein